MLEKEGETSYTEVNNPYYMPSLNWIGREAVTNHDEEVPFRWLKKIKMASLW